MTSKKEQAVETAVEVDIEALRAQIEADVRAQVAAETKVKEEKEAAKVKELEEKIKKQEASLEAQIREEEKSAKQQLKEMEQVWIEIPEDPANPDDIVPVGWNGVIYSIPRGQRFKVPVVIYDIWRDSYERTKEVNKRIRESTKKEITVI